MRIQGIIFDMDGTMIDSMPYHAKSWVAFAERLVNMLKSAF